MRSPKISTNRFNPIIYKNIGISNPVDIADAFSDHLTTYLRSSCYPNTVDVGEAFQHLSNFPVNDKKILSFKKIDLDQLYSCICSIKPSFSDQNGDLPSFIFVDYYEIVDPHLLNLINAYTEMGVSPNSLKLAKVTPLFKKGNKKVVDNYQPICVLPFLSKVFDNVLLKQMISHLDSNNLLHSNQLGFRRGKSTIEAVHIMLDAIYDTLKSKISIPSMNFQLAKALI